ncbi:hypothetical protein CRG98_005680 [Punica granatum]|uniref:Uncharacterized protein n=1 Tax=Punica granatum TaxID=22663 RepID=A0A2I0L1B9_PUNGR|nr:hypothetical protein CRG98_005680 [Punica granatum]
MARRCYDYMKYGNGTSHCAHPNFNLVGVRNARAYATLLGSVHLPGNAQRTCVRRSHHLPFYDSEIEGRNNIANYRIYGKMTETPKVDETGHANKTRTRTGFPFLPIDQGVSTSLTPRMSANHETTIMPFGLRNV